MTSPHKPDQDKPEEDKSFLARWSQRKQEAKQPEPKQDAPAATSDVSSEPIAEVEAEPVFDLSTLPKLEELTETTDITGFLRKGVPEHLRNAALRKSWALDPAIRNRCRAHGLANHGQRPGRIPHSGRRSRDRAGGCVRIIRKSGYVGKTVAGSARSIRETGRREKSFRKRRARCRSERPIGSRQFCCIAAATATSWHRKTDCLDKSFCGHRQRLCYRFLLGIIPVLSCMPE